MPGNHPVSTYGLAWDFMPQRIHSKRDYNFFLEADKIALGDTLRGRKKPKIIGDDIWKFLRLLRKTEYFLNCKNDPISRLYFTLLRYQLYRLSLRLNFYIPPNVCGPGFSIAQQTGPIMINASATIGANCRISMGVLIGRSPREGTPKIGNHVFIGPNAVIVGPIEIADEIAIGANSYVSKSFLEKGITVAGSPARKVIDRGTDKIMIRATEVIGKQHAFLAEDNNDFIKVTRKVLRKKYIPQMVAKHSIKKAT